MVTADYHFPDRGCLVLQPGVENLHHRIRPITLDLCSQSGAYAYKVLYLGIARSGYFILDKPRFDQINLILDIFK